MVNSLYRLTYPVRWRGDEKEWLLFANPELHDQVVLSSNNVPHQFKATLLVESNRACIVAMNHQHEPLRLLLGVPGPLAGFSLPLGDEVGHELPRIPPFRFGRFSSIPDVDPKHRDQDKSRPYALGWRPLPFRCANRAKTNDFTMFRLKQPDAGAPPHRIKHIGSENPFGDMPGPRLLSTRKADQASLVGFGKFDRVQLVWMIRHPRAPIIDDEWEVSSAES